MATSDVKKYTEFLDPDRASISVDSCNWSVNQFENLIDSFVPKDMIKVALRTDKAHLDKFCRVVYNGLNFDETYAFLSSISDACLRNAVNTLAQMGNATALNIAAKHFMKLDDDLNKNNINITIVNDLSDDDDDENEEA